MNKQLLHVKSTSCKRSEITNYQGFLVASVFPVPKNQNKRKKGNMTHLPNFSTKDKWQPTQDHTTSQICFTMFLFQNNTQKNTKNTSQASALDRNTHNACSSCGWSCFVSRFTSSPEDDSPGDKLCLLVVPTFVEHGQHMCFLFWVMVSHGGDCFSL